MMKAFSKILNIILLVILSLSLLTVPCFAAGDDVEFIFSGDEIVIDSSEWTKDQIVVKKSGVLDTWKINACDIYLVDGEGDELFELENKGDADGDGVVRYIMVQGDPENVDAQYRTEKSVEALKAAGVEVEELTKQRGDWDQTKGQEITANALSQYGDKIDVVFCNNDAMALGALQAIEAAGRTVNKDIYLVGVDALVEVVENVMNDKMTGTVFNDYFGQAHTAADKALDFVNGKDVDNVYMVDYVKVTTENAGDILEMIK